MRDQETHMPRSEVNQPAPYRSEETLSPRRDRLRTNAAANPVTPPPNRSSGSQSGDIDHREVGRKLKQDYAHGARDPSVRHLDALHSLVKYLMQADPNLEEMVRQTARAIYSQFSIKEVSIALRSSSDGLYRYVAEHGMRADVWAAHHKLAYTYDEVTDARKYKPITISHHTQLYLAEDNPYGEEEQDTYSEHLMRQFKRKSVTDSVEGDYIDLFLYGPQDEMLGWIEISGTWDGKIPDARTIRCLEIVASVLGIAVTRHRMTETALKTKDSPTPPKRAEPSKK